MTTTYTQEQLLVGGMESVFRTPGVPNLLTDTFDTGDVSVSLNMSRLVRNNKRPTFSPLPARMGRRQQSWSFPVDVAGSGVTDGSRPPMWGRFMRMCGMAQTQISAAGGAIGLARANPANARKDVVPAGDATNNYTGALPRLVVLTATAAGAVTVASHDLPNGDAAYSQTAVVATTGTVIAGPQGSKFKLTYTGSLTLGDSYYFWVLPRGHLYSPSMDPDNAESGYLYHYTGNKRHLLTGGRGTFSMAATAGEYGVFNFNITGDYYNPVDMAFPAPSAYSVGTYPDPAMVELADVSLNNQVLACPTTFGFDMAGSVAARLCANAAGANDGSILNGRAPKATFNMDSVPVATMDIWSHMVQGTQLALHGYIGQQPGNTVMFLATGQITNTPYANLEGLRKNDVSMELVSTAGNDELLIFVI